MWLLGCDNLTYDYLIYDDLTCDDLIYDNLMCDDLICDFLVRAVVWAVGLWLVYLFDTVKEKYELWVMLTDKLDKTNETWRYRRGKIVGMMR